MRDAKRALASSPSRAETFLAEHRRKFPRGDFIEEREALQVEVDWQLGHEARARTRYDRFRVRYPSSLYLPRIEHVLQNQPARSR